MKKHNSRKVRKNHNFFYLVFPPILLAFIILVIIPLITYSSDMYSDANKYHSFSSYINKEIVSTVDDLGSAKTEEELISKLDSISTKSNILIISDNTPIYSSIQIENSPINTIKKELTLNNGKDYIVYVSFSILTKTVLLIGLFFRYLLLVLCLVSFLGINKIRKHIKSLEKATANIASGDYDTPINTEGKDNFVFLDESLENMRIQIKEDRHQIARFFAGVSHDLKTPLSSILGYTEALQDGMANDEETQKAYLGIIHDKSLLLVDRISSLIKYIKITDQGFQTELKQSELYPVLENFCNKTDADLKLQKINFDWALKFNKEYSTAFDEVLLNRALENLIENAIKYGDLSKPISLEATQDYNGISISIENFNATTISAESLSHFFEPFFRADNSRRGKGFGLGLPTVQSIMASHGWEISTNVDEEKNTICFIINIPIY